MHLLLAISVYMFSCLPERNPPLGVMINQSPYQSCFAIVVAGGGTLFDLLRRGPTVSGVRLGC